MYDRVKSGSATSIFTSFESFGFSFERIETKLSLERLVMAHAEIARHDLLGESTGVKDSKSVTLWQPRDDMSEPFLVCLFKNLMQAKWELDLILGSVHRHLGCGWRGRRRSGRTRRTLLLRHGSFGRRTRHVERWCWDCGRFLLWFQ